MHCTVSYQQSKLIAIDKQPDDDGMSLGRAGKADRLTPEAFDPGAQREVLPLYFWRVALARLGLIYLAMTRGRAPRVRRLPRETKRFHQSLALEKHLILAAPYDVRQHVNTVLMVLPPLMTWSRGQWGQSTGMRTMTLACCSRHQHSTQRSMVHICDPTQWASTPHRPLMPPSPRGLSQESLVRVAATSGALSDCRAMIRHGRAPLARHQQFRPERLPAATRRCAGRGASLKDSLRYFALTAACC